jgi:2-aminoadipate transaminase
MDMLPTVPSSLNARRPPFAKWMAMTNDMTRVFLSAGHIPGLINLAGGLPEPACFPVSEISTIARDAIAAYPEEALGYGPVEGLPELRDRLAARFSSEALTLTRANVLVTSGGIQGLDLIGKVLLEEGGLIAGQFPTYLGALDAWRPRSPTFRKMIMEDPDFEPLPALDGAQFAYAVPNFSNPTGRLVGVKTRQALVDAAHRSGTWLIEDDPYGTLHYDGAPPPRMIELCARSRPGAPYQGPVVYMGTLSKEIAPGLDVATLASWPDFSVFARFVTPRGPASADRGSINLPVVIGGRLVAPGDLVIGDDDGLVALSPSAIRSRIADAKERQAREASWIESLASGRSALETFGLGAPKSV